MIPWIQVLSNLPEHPKIYGLMELLGLRRKRDAVGIVVEMWCWVVVNATDGDITRFPIKAIAGAVEWTGSAKRLFDALVAAGWLDLTDDGRVLVHDWEEYAVLLIQSMQNQKKKTRERVKRYRENQKKDNENCNVTRNAYSNVTATECNASTIPNQTIPDHILTTTSTRANAVTYFLERLNSNLSDSSRDELTEYENVLGTEVCIKAMDMAMDQGKTSWNYVRAILENWYIDGVRSVSEVEQREAARMASKMEHAPHGMLVNNCSNQNYTLGESELNAIAKLKQLRDEIKGDADNGTT